MVTQLYKIVSSSIDPFHSTRCNDEELPPDFQEFSDDEQESKVRIEMTPDQIIHDLVRRGRRKKLKKWWRRGLTQARF